MKRFMLTTNRSLASLSPGVVTVMLAGASACLSGCISVKAPEKPIEINLNVTIRQEVVVSLRKDVQDLDQKYPGVF